MSTLAKIVPGEFLATSPLHRSWLVGHARFARHSSQVLRRPLYTLHDVPDLRFLERFDPTLEVMIFYSRRGGIRLSVRGPALSSDPLVETGLSIPEPIEDRISRWMDQVEIWIDHLEFRDQTLLTALLAGFQFQPLRKGHG